MPRHDRRILLERRGGGNLPPPLDNSRPACHPAHMFQFYRPAVLADTLTHAYAASRAARQTALDPRYRLDRLQRYATYTPDTFLEWCRLYLAHAFKAEWGDHHHLIADGFALRGQTVEILIPREHGKTTMVDAFDLYCLCNGLDKYILRFEHDAGVAHKKTGLIAHETQNNPALVADYRLQPGHIWRPNAGELEYVNTQNPYARYRAAYYRAIGVLNISRGTTYHFGRVDRAVMNDVVSSSREAASASWNNFLQDLITKDVGFSGGGNSDQPVTIQFVTTIQAKNDISDRLRSDLTVIVLEAPAVIGDAGDVMAFVQDVSADMPHIRAMHDAIIGTAADGFTGKTVSDDDFKNYCAARPMYQTHFARLKSLWNAQFPMHKHVRDIYRAGSRAWLQEKQHITADGQFQKFFAQWFAPYQELPRGAYEYGIAIDSAGEPRDGTDPVVVLSGAMTQNPAQEFPDLYLLDLWCDQGTPTQIVYTTFQFANRLRDEFGVSRNTLTVFLEGQVGENGTAALFYEIPQKELALGDAATYADGTPRPAAYRDPAYWESLFVSVVAQTVNKIVRLLDFRVIAEQGRIHINPHDPAHQLAVKQFRNFKGEQTHKNLPLEQKIDIPDMVELLYRKLNLPPVNAPVFSN